MTDEDGGQPAGDTERLKPLKFASASRTNAVGAAQDGELAATVRYYDDEKGIESGDRIRLVDEYGPSFAEADVIETQTLPAGDAFAYILDNNARYPKDSYDHMMSALNDHYGGGIYAGTTVKVILFRPDRESALRYLNTDTDHDGGGR